MDSRGPSKKVSSAVTLAATIALGAGWSASALSATTTDAECEGVARDLRTLERPAETYSVRPVDHVSIESDPASLEMLNTADATSETATPFLYLTPRVASVLRDIFDATSESSDQESDRDISSSPVAESDGISETAERIDDAGRVEEEINLPHFQRQMFRTDI